MDDTERLVTLVEHLAGAVDTLTMALGPTTLGHSNYDQVLGMTASAVREAHAIQANAEDHR